MNDGITPFQLNTRIANALASVTEAAGRLSAVSMQKPAPKLRRENRIRTIQASLSIEGNSLTLAQVSALLDKKRVIGPQKDILEVQNAIATYHKIRDFNPFSLPSLLDAHSGLMQGLDAVPGQLRKGPIGVIRPNHIFHEAVAWQAVEPMMGALFAYLNNSDDHLVLKSCRFHYQLEYIHPFLDGNGRMGRLWQTRILMQYHPVFEFIPFEHLIKENQALYYRHLIAADDTRDCTEFMAFILEQVNEAIGRMLADTRSVTLSAEDRLQFVQSIFMNRPFSRKDYQIQLKNISNATASRDLQHGVKNRLLQRTGDKRTTTYVFNSTNHQR